jgi:hypothetical protein
MCSQIPDALCSASVEPAFVPQCLLPQSAKVGMDSLDLAGSDVGTGKVIDRRRQHGDISLHRSQHVRMGLQSGQNLALSAPVEATMVRCDLRMENGPFSCSTVCIKFCRQSQAAKANQGAAIAAREHSRRPIPRSSRAAPDPGSRYVRPWQAAGHASAPLARWPVRCPWFCCQGGARQVARRTSTAPSTARSR